MLWYSLIFFLFMDKDVFKNFNFNKCVKTGEELVNLITQKNCTVIEGISILAIASAAYKEECINLLAKAEKIPIEKAKKIIDGMFNEFCIFYESQKPNEEIGDSAETVG